MRWEEGKEEGGKQEERKKKENGEREGRGKELASVEGWARSPNLLHASSTADQERGVG